MYRGIVRSKVRGTFDRINEGDYQAMLDSLAPSFTYRFHGEHALGGRRTSRGAMTRWWERVMRLLPGARFTVDEVLVEGWPWRTRVAVRTHVAGDLPGGVRYENTMIQLMTLTWGKVTEVETLEDLQVLQRALEAMAEAGIEEAVAAPIQG